MVLSEYESLWESGCIDLISYDVADERVKQLRIHSWSAHLRRVARALPQAAQTPLRACTEMHLPAADSLLTRLSIAARGSAPPADDAPR